MVASYSRTIKRQLEGLVGWRHVEKVKIINIASSVQKVEDSFGGGIVVSHWGWYEASLSVSDFSKKNKKYLILLKCY